MEEECPYEIRLSAMIGRLFLDICAGEFSRAQITSDIDYVCLDFPYSKAWLLRRSSHWHEGLNFEHRFGKRLSRHRFLLGWQNMEVSAAQTGRRARFHVPANLANWSDLRTNHLLLGPTPPGFSYHSNFGFSKACNRLLLSIAGSDFCVCTAFQFLWVAVAGLTEAFKVHSHFKTNFSYLAALSDLVIALIEENRLCTSFLISRSA